MFREVKRLVLKRKIEKTSKVISSAQIVIDGIRAIIDAGDPMCFTSFFHRDLERLESEQANRKEQLYLLENELEVLNYGRKNGKRSIFRKVLQNVHCKRY